VVAFVALADESVMLFLATFNTDGDRYGTINTSFIP
jgi:hypothetical protein